MAVKELRYENGRLLGLFIPIEDIEGLKGDLKTDSHFLSYLDELLFKQQESEPALQELLPNGLSSQQTNDRAAKVITNLHREAFSKGVPMYYRDARATPPKEFIRANPNGSEDLVSLDISTAEYTLIKHLVPKGEGSWAFVHVESESSRTHYN
ncbi:hypothetical protein [Dyadobacter frigoris]|uniref:Uncharacterized protein n=1 Tax=Dyadobacter frigoris TaxID=2576211 RepID=A0A4U6D3V1_9BACT|nr:hypothetical protein [Dyadobacter frigoris]TKT88604.1 hypothetical protein FDK13_27045 [Dyadobacter frigoris]GLU54937.1 hypothetical protein Dfri01_43980 [Dyadobacter frigoris]